MIGTFLLEYLLKRFIYGILEQMYAYRLDDFSIFIDLFFRPLKSHITFWRFFVGHN